VDEKCFKAVYDLYKFLLEKNGTLDAVDISYITGVLKTLTDLYAIELPAPEPKPFSIKDIWAK
jgi:hypothetical protein